MHNILVTGGAGYIGSHACKALSKKGFNPVTYDNLVNGHEWAVKWGPLVVGDINDEKRLDWVIGKYSPLAVMHFAAYAYVGDSIEQPDIYYHNNISGTLSLLKVMQRHSINKIIFSSSCATYGIPEKVPVTEGQNQNPINPYGFSKLAVERILSDFDFAFGLKHIALRYFNAAGADPDGEIGEVHQPETHLIPIILEVAGGKKKSVEILGSDYPTFDGTCIRDYIHVCDLVDAHLLALEYLTSRNESNQFNLGNKNGYSVKEVIEIAHKVTRKKIKYENTERRGGDPPILVGDAKKAMKLLKWSPKYSQLEKIIETAWNWFKVTSA